MGRNIKIIIGAHISALLISGCAGDPAPAEAVGGIDNVTNAFEFTDGPGRVVEVRGAEAPIRMGRSFLRGDGVMCREFEVLLDPPLPGVACRTGAPGWEVQEPGAI